MENDIKLQVISRTKQIAQCQIIVDRPLLFGKAFFERILSFFVPEKMTSDFTWIDKLMQKDEFNKDVFKPEIKQKFIDEIINYYLPVYSFNKSATPELISSLKEDPIFRQLYDIMTFIDNDDIQSVILAYKQNHACIQAYIAMIKRFVKKAIEAGAIIIFFPELAFAHLFLADDKEFMELSRGHIIVAGGIRDVPDEELIDALEENLISIDEWIKSHKPPHSESKEKQNINLEHYEQISKNYKEYIEMVIGDRKPLYYNVTMIFVDKNVYYINKKVVTTPESKHNIVAGKGFAAIKPGIFNIMMINCAEFFGKGVTPSSGLLKKIIRITKYTEKTNDEDCSDLDQSPDLKRMRDYNTPITAAAVISYQDLSPTNWFNDCFEILFKESHIKLGLYTNTGTLRKLDDKTKDLYQGETGLYYRTITEKLNELIQKYDEFTGILNCKKIIKTKSGDIYSIHLNTNIRYGMLVSSYMDDPGDSYLTKLEVFIPKDSEYGELQSQLEIS